MKINISYTRTFTVLCFFGLLISCNNSPKSNISNGDKAIGTEAKEPTKSNKIGDQDFSENKVPPAGLYKYASSVNEAMKDVSNEYAPRIKYINVKIEDGIVSFQTGESGNSLVDNPVDWASKDGDISLKYMFCNHFRYIGNDTIEAMQGGASFTYFDYFVRKKTNSNDKDVQKDNQLSIKKILDLNLRDISQLKNVFGEPFYNEGDVTKWKFVDFEITYLESYPAIVIKSENNMGKITSEFYEDLNFKEGRVNYIHNGKHIGVLNNRIEIEYQPEYEARTKSNYKPYQKTYY